MHFHKLICKAWYKLHEITENREPLKEIIKIIIIRRYQEEHDEQEKTCRSPRIWQPNRPNIIIKDRKVRKKNHCIWHEMSVPSDGGFWKNYAYKTPGNGNRKTNVT